MKPRSKRRKMKKSAELSELWGQILEELQNYFIKSFVWLFPPFCFTTITYKLQNKPGLSQNKKTKNTTTDCMHWHCKLTLHRSQFTKQCMFQSKDLQKWKALLKFFSGLILVLLFSYGHNGQDWYNFLF